jgi:hypothetical protein
MECSIDSRLALLLVYAVGASAVAPASEPATGVQPATLGSVWKSHDVTINYYGRTTLYSCDGLEDKVRQIFQHLGARQDLKVRATACERGPFLPSHEGVVTVSFNALTVMGDAAAADVVRARWMPVDLQPQSSGFLDRGDCELVQEMKDAITRNFSWRSLTYETSCFPGSSDNTFDVKGLVLAPMA